MRPLRDHDPYKAPESEPEPTGPITVVHRRFGRLLGEVGSPAMPLYVIVVGVALLTTLVSAWVQVATDAPLMHEVLDGGARYPMPQQGQGSFLGLLIYPFLIVSVTLYYGSYAVLRACDERDGDVEFSTGLELMTRHILSTIFTSFLVFLIIGLGGCCLLVPGLVAAVYLCQAPYLAAVEGFSPMAAVRESAGRTQRHLLLVLLLIGVSMLAGVFNFGVNFVSLATFVPGMGDAGIYAAAVATWAFSSIVGYFLWVYTGSIFITIGRAEGALNLR